MRAPHHIYSYTLLMNDHVPTKIKAPQALDTLHSYSDYATADPTLRDKLILVWYHWIWNHLHEDHIWSLLVRLT